MTYFILESASENGRPVPGKWVEFSTDTFTNQSWSYSIAISGSIAGWAKIGTLDIPEGEVISIDVAALRSTSGKNTPSKYSLSACANVDLGDSVYLYVGAMYTCDTGTDYVDGVSLDPIAEFVFVRQIGYGGNKADLYVKLNGESVSSLWTITSKAKYFTLDVEVNPIDPGTADNTTYATRKEMFG